MCAPLITTGKQGKLQNLEKWDLDPFNQLESSPMPYYSACTKPVLV